ncbi:MAG: hypothetical protein BGO39_04865 [Chloroflexi bacterium 54-19]|nr:MAG: hypothetical protein BGO39_04865 [Chloroflexi bacterium 54-19]
MQVPAQTVHLSKKYLTRIKTEPGFEFKQIHRAEIYRSFGPSGIKYSWDREKSIRRIQMSIADKVYGWLSVLTAQKVKSIWEDANLEDFEHDEIHYLPTRMLELAEGILNGTADADETNKYTWISGWGFQRGTRKNVYGALASAEASLFTLLHGVVGHSGDFATPALDASACIDRNSPGAWFAKIEGFDFYKKMNHYDNLEFVPLEIDHRKEVEFWEWWFEEALSHAWDLVEPEE